MCLIPTVRIPELNALRKLVLETVAMSSTALVVVNSESLNLASVGEGLDDLDVVELTVPVFSRSFLCESTWYADFRRCSSKPGLLGPDSSIDADILMTEIGAKVFSKFQSLRS